MDDALPQSDMQRGPWSTGLATLIALGPLIVGVTLAIAVGGRSQLGPVTADQIVYWVLLRSARSTRPLRRSPGAWPTPR